MDRRTGSSSADDPLETENFGLSVPEHVPPPEPVKRPRVSTMLPPRQDPFNPPPDPGSRQGQPEESWHRSGNEVPEPVYPNAEFVDQPDGGYADPEFELGGNARFQPPPTRTPQYSEAHSHGLEQATERSSRRTSLILVPALGLFALVALLFLYTQFGGSDDQATTDNSDSASSATTTPQAAALASPSTLETKIVDLDEVSEDDTLRLEIPLEPAEGATEAGVEVDPSLPPLKFTIADGQVLLTGTAQNEGQATAMVERASTVFAGVELIADYQVNPSAPNPISGVVVQKPVVFESGSAIIRPEYYPVLDACAGVLESQPSLIMTVAGHTDNVGGDEINIPLAQKRAEAVIEYYVSKGLDNEQFQQVAMADAAPIASNDTEEGRQDNRRADLEFEGIFKDVIGATD